MTADQCHACHGDRVRHCCGDRLYCEACAASLRAVIVNRFGLVLTWLTATTTYTSKAAR